MRPLLSTAVMAFLIPACAQAADSGDPTRGAQTYQACAACHSLQADRNMTGPSLSGLWGRRAGGLSSFPRYSPALKRSDVVWMRAGTAFTG
jgi:cytochrome c